MNTRGFYTTGAYTEHYLGMRWPQAIWRAVLTQAIDDIVHGPSANESRTMTPAEIEGVRAAARDWVADDENSPRRFCWVCEVLGLEPVAVRRSIEMRRAGA